MRRPLSPLRPTFLRAVFVLFWADIGFVQALPMPGKGFAYGSRGFSPGGSALFKTLRRRSREAVFYSLAWKTSRFLAWWLLGAARGGDALLGRPAGASGRGASTKAGSCLYSVPKTSPKNNTWPSELAIVSWLSST